ncbi:MAG: glycosyltransferase family 39 protein [Solirubrobacterales bacterium]
MSFAGIRATIASWAAGLPARHGGRWTLFALAAIVALGFGLRLYKATHPTANPGADSIVAYQGNDEVAYQEIAKALYRDGHYGTPEMAHPTDWSPGAPFVHASVYYATGGVHPDAARGFVALLGAIMVLLVYLLARRLAGVYAGLGAALLAAIYPTFIDNAGQYVSEPIAAFTLCGAVLSFLWASDPGRSLWAWAVPGLLLGATALTRPEYLMFGAVFALLALLRVTRSRQLKLGVAAAALVAVSFALVLIPWTARNYVVLDKFVPVTTGGGKALFVATYYPGDGRQLPTKRKLIEQFTGESSVSDMQVANTQMSDLLDRVASRYPNLDRDAALARIGRENFRKYFSEHPVGYTEMVLHKMWNVWRRGSGPTMRAPGWIAFHYSILALAIVGLAVLAWRRRWEALVIGVLIAGITVLGGLLLAVPRRNVPLMPIVLALAAAGASYIWIAAAGWIAERRSPKRARVHVASGSG